MWPAPNPLSLNALSMNCFFWANAGYWLNSLFMAGLDFCVPSLASRKVQGSKGYLTVREWLHVATVSAINMTVFNYISIYVLEPLPVLFHGHFPAEERPFSWLREAPRFLLCTVIVDAWLYWIRK